jgi:chromate reductase
VQRETLRRTVPWPRSDVAVLVGSLRKESYSRKLALAFSRLVPPGLSLSIVELRELSMYDQDLDEAPPAAWLAFRERIRRADAVLFVTPEYNRSVPAVLKNAIDIGSRPYGKSAWDGKPCAVISVSPGALGGFGENHHLRQSIVFLNMPVMQAPEAYVGNVARCWTSVGSSRTTRPARSSRRSAGVRHLVERTRRVGRGRVGRRGLSPRRSCLDDRSGPVRTANPRD